MPNARQKAFNIRETVAIVVTLDAPERLKDRVTVDAIREHLILTLNGSVEWPTPDHASIAEWDPDTGYTVSDVASPALYGFQVDVDSKEPPVGSTMLLAGLQWRRGAKGWLPTNMKAAEWFDHQPMPWKDLVPIGVETAYIIKH